MLPRGVYGVNKYATIPKGSAVTGDDAKQMSKTRDADSPHIPAYLELLWRGDQPGGQRPGPKPGIDLHQVAAAGIRLADAAGLAGVSMRAVAAELGYTPMALYRYVASKHELVAVMVDEAYGPPPKLPDADQGWRSRISSWARANREVMQRHRWILEITLSEPPLTPHQIAWMELGLSALVDSGLSPQAMLSCMLLVDVYVRGQAQLAVDTTSDAESRQADQRYATRLTALVDAHQFPHITAALNIDTLVAQTDEFEFGLRTILDGIAARTEDR